MLEKKMVSHSYPVGEDSRDDQCVTDDTANCSQADDH